MPYDIHSLCWPQSRLAEAIEALARQSGFALRPLNSCALPDYVAYGRADGLNKWVEVASECLGVEAQPIETSYSEVEGFVLTAGPAVLRIQRPEGGPLFLALLKGGRRTAVVTPELKIQRVKTDAICRALREDLEAPLLPEINDLLDGVGLGRRARVKAAQAIVQERLRSARIGGSWILRLPPGASTWRQIREAGLPRRLLVLLGVHALEYLILILAWAMIGNGILEGRLDYGWLWAWILLLLTIIPCQLVTTWTQGMLAIGAGRILKRRLLMGALRLQPEEIRHQGAGQLLGRVIESEAVESLALSAGLLGLIAAIELVFAAVILHVALKSVVPVLLFVFWGFFVVCSRSALML